MQITQPAMRVVDAMAEEPVEFGVAPRALPSAAQSASNAAPAARLK
jgi:hypothetical protein